MPAWTDLEKQKLKNLHAQGLMPAEMTGHFSGRTRNSIISQLNRLRLPTRNEWFRKNAINPETDIIIRLRCRPWGWDEKFIAQAVGQDIRTVRKVIETHTEAA